MSRVYPSLAEFKDLSKQGKVVPVALIMEGDLETPINLFLNLCSMPNSYLLESVEGGEKWARYSYLGRHPTATITADAGVVTIKEKTGKIVQKSGPPLDVVYDYLSAYEAVNLPNLPDFTGGVAGQISYNYTADQQKTAAKPHLPQIHLLVNNEVIAYDHLKNEIYIIVNILPNNEPEKAYKQAFTYLHKVQVEISEKSAGNPEPQETSAKQALNFSSNETKASFMAKVAEAKTYIKQGTVSQVVLSQQLVTETSMEPFNVYRRLRRLNPSPYLFFINFGDYQLVGSSPELLAKVKDNMVETCPIAGTRPRGITESKDQKYAQELLADQKELKEHLMLVDLSKSDLQQISRPDTIDVKKYLAVEKYSHVMHLVSHLKGELKPGYTLYDAIKACLPAGTVSGSPKKQAMAIIEQLENQGRGVYGGAVGHLSFNGNMDLCIAIRTIIFHNAKAYVQAGAGIVADSDPEREYEETLIKAKALLVAINS